MLPKFLIKEIRIYSKTAKKSHKKRMVYRFIIMSITSEMSKNNHCTNSQVFLNWNNTYETLFTPPQRRGGMGYPDPALVDR